MRYSGGDPTRLKDLRPPGSRTEGRPDNQREHEDNKYRRVPYLESSTRGLDDPLIPHDSQDCKDPSGSRDPDTCSVVQSLLLFYFFLFSSGVRHPVSYDVSDGNPGRHRRRHIGTRPSGPRKIPIGIWIS